MARLAILVGLALSPLAIAQGGPCWEDNLGNLISTADDVVVGGLALGFNFTGPTGVTTSSIGVSTNGFINLQPDTGSGCCNGSAALLRGGVPRIAPYWTNLTGNASTGGVFFNTFPAAPGVPARAVITWLNMRESGTTTQQIVQCQMYDNGAFTFRYGPNNVISTHMTVVGVSEGGGAAVANPVDFSVSAPIGTPYVSGNPTIHEEFAGNMFDLSNRMFEFIPQPAGGYLVNQRGGCPPTPTVFASFAPYGSGCPVPMVVYELFANGASDLTGTNVLFLPTGSGYLLMNGPAGAYVDPTLSPTAVQLTLGDDQVSPAQSLPFTFIHAGGSTNQICVASNGFIWLNGTSTNARCCAGNAATFTTDPASIAAVWNDLYPPGGGAIYFDAHPSGNVLITWHNVPEYANAAVTCTAQVALMASGAFEIRTVSAVPGMHRSMTGYSAGGGMATVVPPGIDLTAAASVITVLPGSGPLRLGTLANDRPVLGQVFDLQISAIPGGTTAGFMVLGFSQVTPAFDLTPFGLTGCAQHVMTDDLFAVAITGPTAVFSAPIPGSAVLVGLQTFMQAVTLSPGVNPAGYAVSNGGMAVLGH